MDRKVPVAAAISVVALAIALNSLPSATAPRALLAVPTPSETPSFITAVTLTAGTPPPTLAVPGEEMVGGQSYIVYGADGTQFHIYEQVNRILSTVPSPTPTPAPTPVPTPTPTAPPSPTPIVTPPPPTPAPLSSIDDAAMTYFGAWNTYVGGPRYGVGDHYSGTAAAAFGFLFTGSEVKLYASTAPWCGIATISVDGKPPVDVDWYSAAQTDPVLVWDSGFIGPGNHRIVATVARRKQAAATDFIVSIDRADVMDGTLIPPLTP